MPVSSVTKSEAAELDMTEGEPCLRLAGKPMIDSDLWKRQQLTDMHNRHVQAEEDFAKKLKVETEELAFAHTAWMEAGPNWRAKLAEDKAKSEAHFKKAEASAEYTQGRAKSM
ncbi:unnamed protein product [marine sediment metagenome]|uniref:Uncharacterized protein n=1 Tax=marine sediment metagenome TaxID=412755 RepID=X1K263_9ZZZZ